MHSSVAELAKCQDHIAYRIWLAPVRVVIEVVRATTRSDAPDEAIVRADACLHVVTDPCRGAGRAHAVRVASHHVRDRGGQFQVEGRRETVDAGVRGARVAMKQMHKRVAMKQTHSYTRIYREANILGIHVATIPREI